MRNSDISNMPSPLSERRFVKSLSALSENLPRAGEPVKRCLEQDSRVGQLSAIDFDAVKDAWCAGAFPFKCKSSDALFYQDGVWHLVEFKTGGARVENIIRKVYDSVILLVSHNVLSWEECREKLMFVSVQVDARDRFQYYELRGQKYEYELQDIKPKQANLDPRVLTGQVAKKVYVMDVPDFVSYAESWE